MVSDVEKCRPLSELGSQINNTTTNNRKEICTDISGIEHALVTLSCSKNVAPYGTDRPRPHKVARKSWMHLDHYSTSRTPARKSWMHLDHYSTSRTLAIGVILTQDGFVLACATFLYDFDILRKTNSKVVNIDKIFTNNLPRKSFRLSLVHLDTSLDVAILKINSSEAWQPAELGSSSSIEIGQKLHSVSSGAYTMSCQTSNYTVVSGACPCSKYFHAHLDSLSMQFTRGIFVLNGKVVGLDIIYCVENKDLAHVLPINSITKSVMEHLKKKSLDTWSWLGGVKLEDEEDGGGQELTCNVGIEKVTSALEDVKNADEWIIG